MRRYSARVGYRTRGGVDKQTLVRVQADTIAEAATKAADKVRANGTRHCAEVRSVDAWLEKHQ